MRDKPFLALMIIALVSTLADHAYRLTTVSFSGFGLVDGMFQIYGINTSDGISTAEVALNPLFYTKFLVRIASWDYSFFEGPFDILQQLARLITVGIIAKSFGRSIVSGLSRVVGGGLSFLRGA